jgi:tetratricopeptide (TPR) repeat protein
MFKTAFRSHLNPMERRQVRALVVADALALASIFALTILLAVSTYFLFQSYKTHRKDLADRWFARGQKALNQDHPLVAIDDLHSALLYAPGQRQIEVTLASALASAGRTQEAIAYFNTLWESEPGNGEINVQLARLWARSGNEDQAKHYYHAAIYGNWEGDGYLRRRDTRLELVRYLISRGRFDQARSELLVAAGNAPASDLEVQSLIAGLMVEDHSPKDALALYQQLLTHAPNDFRALEGAAETAYSLGQYRLAYRYFQKAVNASEGKPALAGPNQADDEMLHKVARILILDPSPDMAPATLAARILSDREIAHQRLLACPDNAAGQLDDINAQWAAEPKRLTTAMLAADPLLQKKEIQLIADTETATAVICGTPTGDDAILLRLAQVPSAADEMPDHE